MPRRQESLGERIAAFTEPDGGYPRALDRIPSPLYRSSGEKTKDEQAFAYLAEVSAPRRRCALFGSKNAVKAYGTMRTVARLDKKRNEENIGGVAAK